MYMQVKLLDYSPLETDWETTLLGRKVELEWRLKVFPRASNLLFWISSHQGTLSCSLNSENHIIHVINHEWNRTMNVASAMSFVWDTKPDFPSPYLRQRIFTFLYLKTGFICISRLRLEFTYDRQL